ncbi:MAG: ribulose-phosphate 3-epimerase [Candidatus Hydrothermales bacterium]
MIKNRIRIGPSIIAGDFSNLKKTIRKIEKSNSDFIHVDVMDGNFVNNITFGPMIVEAIRKLTNMPISIHLMIIEPIRYIKRFKNSVPALISFHIESTKKVRETIEEIHHFTRAGLALNPETKIEEIESYLNDIEEVLVMSVNPGFSGQKFIEGVLDKIKMIREVKEKNKYKFEIAVDGGLNKETIPLVLEAGATTLCIGSFFFKYRNIKSYIKKLKNLE